MINPFKAFLLTAGGAIGAAAIAYYSGALDRYLTPQPISPIASVQSESAPAAATEGTAGRIPQQEAAVPAVEDQAEKSAVVAPAFDIVRAEPDGSIVVAGKAAAGATIEIVGGAQTLGKTTAGPDGDFAIVVEEPLKPGSHQLVLRATGAEGLVATSSETAVVSIPDTKDGQVLALVESPGEASKLITVPEPVAPSDIAPPPAAIEPKPEKALVAKAQEPSVAAEPAPEVIATAQPTAPLATARPVEPVAPPVGSAPASAIAAVSVDAVEIEGRKIFVAGAADPGRRVRVYANDILLGDAISSPNGRFLIEAERDLPVGDYIVRADALERDGVKVAARAAVPFSREAGEAIAAVAPVPVAVDQPAPSVQVVTPPAAEALSDSAPEQLAAATPEQLAAAAPVSPKLESVDGSVIIRRGDTLWQISRRVYGRGVRFSTIYLANQSQISDPDRIWPGQIFNLPTNTPEGEAADMSEIESPPADETKSPL
ncbi:Ig-like domain-containing protein [Mesorhizobium sp. NBSH29]|uniref:Ig-like domain-containing protein n=1 Tax=Mesorhizobium sp. NBSH29 TaxID=2654249 RepID=UPI0027E59F2B|nr:Ig-like domain-containing protein [Mesorhizobium sp. NBSH29]